MGVGMGAGESASTPASLLSSGKHSGRAHRTRPPQRMPQGVRAPLTWWPRRLSAACQPGHALPFADGL